MNRGARSAGAPNLIGHLPVVYRTRRGVANHRSGDAYGTRSTSRHNGWTG